MMSHPDFLFPWTLNKATCVRALYREFKAKYYQNTVISVDGKLIQIGVQKKRSGPNTEPEGIAVVS